MAADSDRATSIERTYRYLRIGIASTVVVIAVSVVIASATVGWLTSVSDYYYTPARAAFVGALVAASLALFALSGHGLERALLDAAAMFAPLIALVPTTLAPLTIPGVEVPCRFRCFPPEFIPYAENGVLTYLTVGVLALATVALLVGLGEISLPGIAGTVALAIAVLLAVGLTWALDREAFLAQAHFVATTAFFALFAAAAVLNAFPRRDPPTPPFRVAYVTIAVLLVVVLGFYVTLAVLADEIRVPTILLSESAALALFFAFWVVQCIEKWNDPNPSLRGDVLAT